MPLLTVAVHSSYVPLPTIAVPFNKLAAPSSICIFEQSVSFVKYYFKDAQKIYYTIKNELLHVPPLLINDL